ncbi:MAG: hypothetical protein FWF76_02680 [Oscillospiraceae bacterium]|nr:hypothetical protein [Oscillospiraceae bacterium]
MSKYDINSNPQLVHEIIECEKKAYNEILKKSDSLVPLFDEVTTVKIREFGLDSATDGNGR